MVIIEFPNGSQWYKANWAFRQLREDVIKLVPADERVKLQMWRAEAFGALFLGKEWEEEEGKEVRQSVLQALRKVAQDTLNGHIKGWIETHPDDKNGQRMYLEAMAELLRLSE